MSRRVIPCVCLLLSAGMMMSGARAAGQAAAVPARASDAPISVTLLTVILDLSYFAGQRVRIPAVRVRDVISERALLVEPASMPRSGMVRHTRAIVTLSTPLPDVARGALLEIVGRPWTAAEARMRIDRAVLDELSTDDALGKRPVIEAEQVRTVGGLPVYATR